MHFRPAKDGNTIIFVCIVTSFDLCEETLESIFISLVPSEQTHDPTLTYGLVLDLEELLLLLKEFVLPFDDVILLADDGLKVRDLPCR